MTYRDTCKPASDGPFSLFERKIQDDKAGAVGVANSYGRPMFVCFVNECHGYENGYRTALGAAQRYKEELEGRPRQDTHVQQYVCTAATHRPEDPWVISVMCDPSTPPPERINANGCEYLRNGVPVPIFLLPIKQEVLA